METLQFLLRNLPNLLVGFPEQRPGGVLLSVLLALFSVGIGFAVAALVGSGRESRHIFIRRVCQWYVDLIRGLPFILLLILIHQVVGTRRFGLDLSASAAALIALVLYSSAYQAEIVRAGLRAVPTQIVDTARVVGGSPWQVFQRVKLRYAFRVMLPALTGQAISLFKDTSVLVVIGVAELMTVSRSVLGSDVTNNARWVSLYLFVGFIYFSIAFSVSRLAQRWERRNRSDDLVHSLANY